VAFPAKKFSLKTLHSFVLRYQQVYEKAAFFTKRKNPKNSIIALTSHSMKAMKGEVKGFSYEKRRQNVVLL